MTPDLNIPLIAVQFVLFLMALTLHECSHAWTANRFGDPTARLQGRISLSPLPHIDPVGTILFPLLGAISGVPVIGWARPTPVDPANLAHPRRDGLWISAAGPLSNLLLATVFLFVLGVGSRSGLLVPSSPSFAHGEAIGAHLFQFAFLGFLVNVSLAFFNLLPIPPLDGGGVLGGLLPESMAQAVDRVGQFGFIILYALILIPVGGLSLLSWLFLPVRLASDFAVRLVIGV